MTKLYCTNLDFGDQSKVLKYFKLRRPPSEDNIKITQWNNSATAYVIILIFQALSLDDQTIFFKSSKLRRPTMEDVLKILIIEHLNNHGINCELGGNLRKTLCVVLLSSACCFIQSNCFFLQPKYCLLKPNCCFISRQTNCSIIAMQPSNLMVQYPGFMPLNIRRAYSINITGVQPPLSLSISAQSEIKSSSMPRYGANSGTLHRLNLQQIVNRYLFLGGQGAGRDV